MSHTEAIVVLVVSIAVVALGLFEIVRSEFVLDTFLERQLAFLPRESALAVVKAIGLIMVFIGFVVAITSVVNLFR